MAGEVFAGLSLLDLILIAIFVLSVLIGLARGMVRTLVSIITWVAAVYLAYTFATDFTHLSESFISNAETRLWGTRIVIFIIVMVIGAIIGNVIYQLISVGGMKRKVFDRVLGMVFGLVLGVFIVSTLILVAGFTDLPDSEMFITSKLVPEFMGFVNYLREFIPEDIRKNIHFPSDPIIDIPAPSEQLDADKPAI